MPDAFHLMHRDLNTGITGVRPMFPVFCLNSRNTKHCTSEAGLDLAVSEPVNMKWPCPILFIAAVLIFVCLPPTADATPIPADAGCSISLDGTWRFKLEQCLPDENKEVGTRPIKTPTTFDPFFALDYREDDAWHDFAVPGNWEMAGYSPATHVQPDNAIGQFRKVFKVPAGWAGRVVKINFDGVEDGAEIWLNGKPVPVTEPSWGRANYHESGWTAWQADLTGVVKFGRENVLALRITKNTRSMELDSGGGYFYLGGIYRPVTLFCVPRSHIEDFTVQTRLLDAGKAEVRVKIQLSGAPQSVSMRLGDRAAVLASVAGGRANLTEIVEKPRLWSAEHPDLYPLSINLKDAQGIVVEKITRRVGIREVSIKNGILLLNGKPIKLTGICAHDLDPDHGHVMSDKLWRKDLALMKAANINAIRTAHYPFDSHFYDLCDELGFYVADELPYCTVDTGIKEMEPAFLQRTRESINRDKNHACVIIWALGNENFAKGSRNGYGCNEQSSLDLVKKMDRTRPNLVTWKKADLYGSDFDDLHYTAPGAILKAAKDRARRAKWPHIYLENPNVWDVRFGADYGSLDLWAEVMRREWDVIWKYDGISGSFLWEWQDRAVADKCPVKLQTYDPVTGLQHARLKGIVDAYRHPRPEYYHVKMVYSPVKVSSEITRGTHSVGLRIENHYTFTDLSGLRTDWQLTKEGKTLERGTAKLRLAPRTNGTVTLALPAGALRNADALRVDFNHPGGWNVVSYQFELAKPMPLPAMSARLPDGLAFPRFNLVVSEGSSDSEKLRKSKHSYGQLINVMQEPADKLLGDVHSMEADVVLDTNPSKVIGHVKATFDSGKLGYRIDWMGPKADIQELGWIFEMPKSFDHFSWKRQAVWSVYPQTHIGRPAGTALPDTADVHISNVTRPDAFDFNSTKYRCDWASLTDASGHGLEVEFAAADRHQVRGGLGSGGAYQLVVNKQSSPPRDLSSNVVPDFYMNLSQGDIVEGGFRVGSE
jgi:beta-galactosidase